jgi:prephenate dehydrogenase
MDAGRHDRVLAGTSHLPHVAAAAVAGTVPIEWLPYSAGGFRDTTRVAGGDPQLWAAILLENAAAVRLGLHALVSRLGQARDLLEAGDRDGLVRWLAEAKRVRDALGT